MRFLPLSANIIFSTWISPLCFAFFICFSPRCAVAKECGTNCTGCDGDEASCSAARDCFYLVDTDLCRIKFDCLSKCRLCGTESECNTGAGGLCVWLGNGLCVGTTCDTECEECAGSFDPLPTAACINSSAPYTGCVSAGEICEFNTRNPTTDPTVMPITSDQTQGIFHTSIVHIG